MAGVREWLRVRVQGATELDDVIAKDFPAQGARQGPRRGDTEWCSLSSSKLERGEEMTWGGSRWPMRTRRAVANAALPEETVRGRAVRVARPAVHVQWCVDFRLGWGISECGNRHVCRGRLREKPEPEPEQEAKLVAVAEARDRIGLVSTGRLAL